MNATDIAMKRTELIHQMVEFAFYTKIAKEFEVSADDKSNDWDLEAVENVWLDIDLDVIEDDTVVDKPDILRIITKSVEGNLTDDKFIGKGGAS
jgi:hypothetical protein